MIVRVLEISIPYFSAWLNCKFEIIFLLQLLHGNAQIGIAGRRLNMNFYKVEEFHLQAISNFLTCENKESNFSSHALA